MLLTLLTNSVAFYLTANLLPGFEVKGAKGALVSAALFGFFQWLLGTALFGLIGVFTLFVGFLVPTLTRLVVAWLLLMLADAVTDLLTIRDKRTAFVGALAITGIAFVSQRVIGILT